MHRLVIAGGRVFDGTGAEIRDADIAIEDGRIAEVGTGLVGDERVDGTGTTILPGLIDCHVHVMFGSVDIWRVPHGASGTYGEVIKQVRRGQRELPL